MKLKTILKRAKGFEKVESMKSQGAVANQTIIYFENMQIFQSYKSIIAVKVYGWKDRIYLGKNWDYSNTTGKYRNIFLNEDKKETQKKIDYGEYKILEE